MLEILPLEKKSNPRETYITGQNLPAFKQKNPKSSINQQTFGFFCFYLVLTSLMNPG
jgi:hypothetical protein